MFTSTWSLLAHGVIIANADKWDRNCQAQLPFTPFYSCFITCDALEITASGIAFLKLRFYLLRLALFHHMWCTAKNGKWDCICTAQVLTAVSCSCFISYDPLQLTTIGIATVKLRFCCVMQLFHHIWPSTNNNKWNCNCKAKFLSAASCSCFITHDPLEILAYRIATVQFRFHLLRHLQWLYD